MRKDENPIKESVSGSVSCNQILSNNKTNFPTDNTKVTISCDVNILSIKRLYFIQYGVMR